MISKPTIRELFAHGDWANEKLLTLADQFSDGQLDTAFEMGEGSLRKTLNHIWSAECVWLDRWKRSPAPRYRLDPAGASVAQFRDEFQQLATERNEFITLLSDPQVSQPLTYTNRAGKTYTYPLDILLLHVANHGVHHRAQAVNMLKRIDAPEIKPGLDYIYWKLEQPGGGTRTAQPPAVDRGSIQGYFAYADWARDQVHAAAAPLSDEQLDRAFPIGLGTLRKTLLHIRFAEQWWLENWQGGGRSFPELDDSTSIAQLVELFAQTAAQRNAYIAALSDADLARFVEARPRPGVVREFPHSVTMLQLCCHGTHHRAQALNMLRHVGGKVQELDVPVMFDR